MKIDDRNGRSMSGVRCGLLRTKSGGKPSDAMRNLCFIGSALKNGFIPLLTFTPRAGSFSKFGISSGPITYSVGLVVVEIQGRAIGCFDLGL